MPQWQIHGNTWDFAYQLLRYDFLLAEGYSLIVVYCFQTAMTGLGNRALNCISTMLESTCSRSAGEPVAEKFCDYLVRVMVDDDGQLIRSIETLFCIYRKTSMLCKYGLIYLVTTLLSYLLIFTNI